MPLNDKHSITRRDLIRGAATGMISLALRADITGAQPPTRPPNIVFILADDLGYADVSCYGRPDLSTPNIDRIAARGVRFLQAYANSAVCSATRTALITGRYQYRLRVGLEEPIAGNANVGLPPEHPTLPSLLRKAGYSSTLVGKWHLGVLPNFSPLKSGYDHFYGFRGGAVDYFSHTSGQDKEDLWDDDVLIHQARLPDGFARQSRGRGGQPAGKVRKTFHGQPSLQRATLALGGSRRRGGVGALAATW